MAKQQVQQKEKAQAAKQVQSTTPFLFDRTNYIIMVAGVLVVILGFVLMSGGATDNPAVFPKEEIYSTMRITIAPIVVILGFAIEIFAILKRPKVQ